jgi:hypothetical protein
MRTSAQYTATVRITFNHSISMKSIASKLSVLLAACAITACSTVTVTTDYDHSAAFGKYKTYTLAPASHGQTLSPTSEAALRNAVRTQLAARGITESKNGKGDLAIVRHSFTKAKVSVQQYTDWGYGGYGGAWPYAYGSYGMWAGAPRTYTSVNNYTEGTLILDVVDTHTNKLVFRGTGTAVVDGPESNAKKIEKAVAKMVAGLPAPASR